MKVKITSPTAIARRIRALKVNQSFDVETKNEQAAACHAGRILKQAGSIEFRVITYLNDKGSYTVKAVNP